MDFDTNWKTAMDGHTSFGELANSAPPEGGGKKPNADKPYTAPKDYKPSTSGQRKNWNQFLDYLDQKKVGGSKDLDARDKGLGMKLLQQYNKEHPDAAVSQDFIPTVQYESYLMRRQNSFPGLTAEQGKYAFAKMGDKWANHPISPQDNWLGSYTSKQYYPTFERETKSGRIPYGTNFEDYVSGVNLQNQ